jgi:hypothetical protein
MTKRTRGSAHWACIAHLTIEWCWSKFQISNINNSVNVKHWLLGWWYPQGLIVHQHRYLYLRWPFFFIKHSWTNSLQLRVRNSYVEGREVKCLMLLQEEGNLDCMYSNRSLEFVRIHIWFTPPLEQTVGIPMGTKCAPILADLFLYSYEADFIQRFIRKNEKKLTLSFNFTFRYIDDVFSLHNSRFGDFFDRFYPIELEISIKEILIGTTGISYQLLSWYDFPYAGAAGMYLHMNGKFTKGNWNHLFCRKVSFLAAPHCQFRGVCQGIKQTYLYLWYLLFQAQLWVQTVLLFLPTCSVIRMRQTSYRGFARQTKRS